jgi:N-acetylglucosamine kinase-like BadF-type ATPase
VAIFLGIDGGGSKTTCIVGDETSVLARAVAAGSNVVRVGELRARKAITSAVQMACADAGIIRTQITRSCAGFAGSARPEIHEFLLRTMGMLVPGEIEVVTDAHIALQAAFGDSAGVIVIAGTGSIAYGRTVDGAIARAGGWGSAVSDEGSGHWIGKAAVSATLRAFDEGKGTALLETLMAEWKVTTHEQLIMRVNASPAPDYAPLFPAVLAAAKSSDPVAREILARAGTELSGLAKVVIRRAFSDSDAVSVAMTGGVFQNSPIVCESFYNDLTSGLRRIVVSRELIDPVQGALAMARAGKRKESHTWPTHSPQPRE